MQIKKMMKNYQYYLLIAIFAYGCGPDITPTEMNHTTSDVLFPKDSKILYRIDEKIVSIEEVNKVDPTTIESIDVIKNNKDIERHAPEGYDGVVIIHLKKK